MGVVGVQDEAQAAGEVGQLAVVVGQLDASSGDADASTSSNTACTLGPKVTLYGSRSAPAEFSAL